jgi:hypothetical protein
MGKSTDQEWYGGTARAWYRGLTLKVLTVSASVSCHADSLKNKSKGKAQNANGKATARAGTIEESRPWILLLRFAC